MKRVVSGLLLMSSMTACVIDEPFEIDTVEVAVTAVLETAADAHGDIATLPTAGPVDSSPSNLFFANLGTNGRTCFSCHLPEAGWSITPAIARAVATANPSSPLFHPIDGSDCPLSANTNPTANSTELMQFGNIRIDIGIPAGADFTLNGFADPKRCASPPTASRLYLYRRPLPTTNVVFLPTVMWDGRESTHPTLREDLETQANSATVGHAQALAAISATQRAAIVDFEVPLFTAQTRLKVGTATVDLATAGGNGGPTHLATAVAPAFFVGINDTFDPGFDREAFTIYRAWEPPATGLSALQASIGRGERIFNTRTFSITGVRGLNGPDDASQAPVSGTCTTCHNSPNVGNHSSPLPIDIGIAEASSQSPAGKTLNISHLPIYSFRSKLTSQVRTVTDPGRALITGRFKDIGKMKGPILRGLAAREPLFHNGSASVVQAVSFYNLRFNIGLTSQERTDLANFLKAL